MLVILEGQERTGKTTLATELCRQVDASGHSVEVKKFEKRSRADIGMLAYVLPLALDDSKLWIVDRGHITEIVYRTMDESIDRKYFDHLMYVDDVLAQFDTHQVYLRADKKVLNARHAETGRETVGSIERIRELFDLSIAASHIPTSSFSTNKMTVEDIASDLLKTFLKGEMF